MKKLTVGNLVNMISNWHRQQRLIILQEEDIYNIAEYLFKRITKK